MRKKRVQKTYTVADRFGRKKKIIFRGTVEYVPYPSEEAKVRAYREWVRVSLKALERKKQEEKRRAEESQLPPTPPIQLDNADKKPALKNRNVLLDEYVVDVLVNLRRAGDTLSDVVRRLVERAFGDVQP